MTRVDFYVLAEAGETARERFACRLVEKACRLENRVFIHAGSPATAQRMDSLLWTFRDASFVPHVIDATDLEPALAEATPVRIGGGDEPDFEAQLLVNLAEDVPLFFSRFDRVAEIVPADPEARGAMRERYRFYRDRGYEMETHKMGGRS
ncbi:MAG: DNA polymerase III subunit chi [Gammaproteobacteria bacterium]